MDAPVFARMPGSVANGARRRVGHQTESNRANPRRNAARDREASAASFLRREAGLRPFREIGRHAVQFDIRYVARTRHLVQARHLHERPPVVAVRRFQPAETQHVVLILAQVVADAFLYKEIRS